jgi:hypothetical protein
MAAPTSGIYWGTGRDWGRALGDQSGPNLHRPSISPKLNLGHCFATRCHYRVMSTKRVANTTAPDRSLLYRVHGSKKGGMSASGHLLVRCKCPLLGVKRTKIIHADLRSALGLFTYNSADRYDTDGRERCVPSSDGPM